MSEGISQLPEERLLEFSKSVEFAATKVFEGVHSIYRSGRGIEFQSASPFSAGEEARFIDWKRYASTDRLYINRYQREEKAGWRIWLDASPSMFYQNKSQWARLWTGALIYLAKAWGDPWVLAPDMSHSVEEAFHFLASENRGREVSFQELERQEHPTDRLVLISDFFMSPEELAFHIRKLENLYHSVHLIQVLSPKERSFDFSEVTEFLDLESDSKLVLDARSVKKAYLDSYQRLEQKLKALVSDRVSFMLCMSENERLEQQLIHFFENM